jgi:hypothetical protein
MTGNFEAKLLDLISEMQVQLATALNSLTGKQHKGLQDTFPVFSASHIDRALNGYILLRRASRIYASKLLIRPALEGHGDLLHLNRAGYQAMRNSIDLSVLAPWLSR